MKCRFAPNLHFSALESAAVRGGCRGRPGGHVPPLDPGYTKKNIDPIPLQLLNLYSQWTVDQQLELSSFKMLP